MNPRWAAALVVSLGVPVAVARAGQPVIDFWDASRGLPGNSATALAQTPDGYLWVGTYNGLARFDGVRFVTFAPADTPALRHPRIQRLAVDEAGTLWISTHDGSLTSWRDGRFHLEWSGTEKGETHVWMVSSRPAEQVILLQSGVLQRRTPEGGAWGTWQTVAPPASRFVPNQTGTAGGDVWIVSQDERLWRLSGGGLSEVPWPPAGGRYIRLLTTDQQDRLWLGTDRGIALWNGSAFEDRTPENGPAALDVRFLRFTAEGDFWAIASGELWQGRDRRWIRRVDGARHIAANEPWTILSVEDGRGGAWFGHSSRGLVHVDAGGNAHVLGTAEGFASGRVKSLIRDREENVWVSADRGGLARLTERRFQVVSPSERGPAHPAVSLSEDGAGAMWIGTLGAGLLRFQRGELTPFSLPGAVPPSVFAVVPGPDGAIWTSAGNEDLWRLEGGTLQRAPWPVHGIKALLCDRAGRVWMGRKDGLSRWSSGLVEEMGAEDGLGGVDVRALAEDGDGSIWVGAGDGSIHRYRDGRRFQRIGTPSSHPVWCLLADAEGVIWAGTYQGGLLRVSGDRVDRFTVREGLVSDVVCQLVEDDAGHLWIGSREGLLRVPKTGFEEVASEKRATLPASIYGRADAIPPLECSGYQPSSARARDGRLWFATTRGAVSVSPADLRGKPVPPPVVIEEVTIDGETRAVSSGSPARDGEGVVVPAGRRAVEFRYTGLSLKAPEGVRFRYRLEGFERDWVDAGTRRLTQYSYLPPGRYRFHVVAGNSDGVWNEEGAVVAVTMLPHYWETWWFKTLLAVTSLAVAAGAARHLATRKLRENMARLERQRAIERDRARIAKDIHDDLGAGLTQISLLSALLRSDSPQEARGHVEQIGETAADLTKAMDEIVWAVNPREDTLEGLWSYLGHFAQEYLGTAGIQCRLHTPEPLPSLPLSAEIRHNVFLAVKEALHNVVKHAGAGEVHLELEVEADRFAIEIRDDGRGIDPAYGRPGGRGTAGQGLHNLAQRMGAIGGRLDIDGEAQGGTRVRLEVTLR